MLAAKISFDQGAVSLDCVMLNISQTGARLSVSADSAGAFAEPVRAAARIVVHVRMVGRRGNVRAVALESLGAKGRNSTALARKKAFEEENRRLRILIADLQQRLKRMQQGP